MEKVLYKKYGRIARITLNRPDVMNAIDDDLPRALSAAVVQGDADPEVHVMVLAGSGAAFCAGYNLTYYAERHSPEGINFKQRMETVGWKQAVNERDLGTYDWTLDCPMNTAK